MNAAARDLLAVLARDGKAPVRSKGAIELIAAGLATKGRRGLALTPAGAFAARTASGQPQDFRQEGT